MASTSSTWKAAVLVVHFLSSALLMVSCATAEPESGLSYYLALRNAPIPGDSTRAEGEVGWVDDIYVSPSGTEVSVVRRATPELSLAIDAILGVVLYRSSWSAALAPSSRAVETRLELDAGTKKRLDAIANEHPGYWLLVTYRGASIDLIPIGVNLSVAVSGGTFSSEDEARSFYRTIASRIRAVTPSAGDVQARREVVDRSAGAVLWHIKCDEEFRSGLDVEGFDASGFLSENEDLVAELDCSTPPPEVPGAGGVR